MSLKIKLKIPPNFGKALIENTIAIETLSHVTKQCKNPKITP